MELNTKRLTETAVLPFKAYETDAGFDIFADEDVILTAGGTKTISTGIAVSIPPHFYGRLKGRSGYTSKTPFRVQEGTIDSGYHGEIKVIAELRSLTDHSSGIGLTPTSEFAIKRGMKIAQLIICELPKFEIIEVDHFEISERGDGGFGSSGK